MPLAGFSNLDYPTEVEEFIPTSPALSRERAARRGHVISFCGGVFAGIAALLAVQWLSQRFYASA